MKDIKITIEYRPDGSGKTTTARVSLVDWENASPGEMLDTALAGILKDEKKPITVLAVKISTGMRVYP